MGTPVETPAETPVETPVPTPTECNGNDERGNQKPSVPAAPAPKTRQDRAGVGVT